MYFLTGHFTETATLQHIFAYYVQLIRLHKATIETGRRSDEDAQKKPHENYENKQTKQSENTTKLNGEWLTTRYVWFLNLNAIITRYGVRVAWFLVKMQ